MSLRAPRSVSGHCAPGEAKGGSFRATLKLPQSAGPGSGVVPISHTEVCGPVVRAGSTLAMRVDTRSMLVVGAAVESRDNRPLAAVSAGVFVMEDVRRPTSASMRGLRCAGMGPAVGTVGPCQVDLPCRSMSSSQ
jgi:hypothetical protein